MEKQLFKEIQAECNKLIHRHYGYLFQLEETIRRKNKRLDIEHNKRIMIPEYWQVDDGFNPFKVHNQKKISVFAYSLNKKLKDFSYSPCSSIVYQVPKDSGGSRDTNVFQIPDAAISRYFYESLLNKNVNLFSSYAYAYRKDRDAHDAIRKLSIDWRAKDRVFVAEFDFRKFFDTISHDYLLRVLESKGFLFTEIENHVINAFLISKSNPMNSYQRDSGVERKKGIPQGTSISLFLANIACWELDLELENIGVRFARYADDTIIWTNCYEKIIKAYDAIDYFCKQMGVQINFNKSRGISIISENSNCEIKSAPYVQFLGYEVHLSKISILEKSRTHIKDRISLLIYENLIQPLRKGIFNHKRLNMIDWDYLVALSQVRRYLYGGLDDNKLRRFRLGIIPFLRFYGVMGYYPLVDDEAQLKDLDGWLINTLKNALILRNELWMNHDGTCLPGPCTNWIDEISAIKKWKNPKSGIIYDFRIPSFLQINRTIRIGMKKVGLYNVTNPRSRYYPSSFPIKINK